MATVLKIKRSSTANAPATLGQGEVAYSWGSGATNGQRLYIGTGTETGGNAANIEIIGGKYYTDRLKFGGTDFANSLLIGHSTTGTLNAASYNTGVGYEALDALTSGDYNTAIGYLAGSAVTTGSKNTGIGLAALKLVAGGNLNTAIGNGAGDNITSGSGNVIIGDVTADSATGNRQLKIAGNDDSTITTWISGDSSGNLTFSGKLQSVTDPTSAQDAATKAYVDTAITAENLDFQGDSGGALEIDLDSETLTIAGGTGIDTVGATNTLTVAIDSTVMTGKTEGTNFTNSLLVGHSTTGTLVAGNDAQGNTGVGLACFDAITTGDYNTALGYDAGGALTQGTRNVLIGRGAGRTLTTQTHNTILGDYALSGVNNTSATHNIAIGYSAGDNITSGGGNVVIGVADVSSATGDDQLSISDGEDGSVVWLTGDSSANVTVGGNIHATNIKTEGTNFTGSLLVGHSTTGTLDAAQYNTGVGLTALDAITSGDNNTAVGYGALTANLSGQRNVALGVNALVTNSSGQQNVAIGHGAVDNANASYNVGIGTDALTDATGGKNTAVGHRAGFAVAGGEYNINIGYTAGDNITSGSGNVVIGKADVASATGDDQLSISDGEDGSVVWLTGDSAGEVTVPATLTTTVNSQTGVAIPGKLGGTNFSNSLLIGHSTTGTLNSATANIGVGNNTLYAITSGDFNIAIGSYAGGDITTSSANTVVGVDAGRFISTSSGYNTLIGNTTSYYNATGTYNTTLGASALKGASGQNNSYNTAIGGQALYAVTTGDYNLGLGYQAGNNITSGSGNVVIGKANVSSATGDDQLSISDGEDGSVVWLTGDSSGNLTFNGKLKNVTDPTAAQDVATKSYVDAVATGLDVKDSVTLATTAALATSTYANGAGTITANANGALSVDGVAVAVDDRILVKNQASALQNGIYKVTATGSAGAVFVLTRTPDADAASEITGGAFTFVEKGTVNADNGYVFTHDGTPTLGSTAITVAQFSGAGQITAGAALSKTNNTLDVEVDDSSIQVTSDALNVKALGVTNAMLAGSIANAKLANSVITVTDGTNSTATALGGTVTFTESEAIDITESSGTVTIAAEVATSANKGVASFNTGNFTVASGDVTVTTIDGGSY